MEDSTLSVEQLSIGFGDNKAVKSADLSAEKDFVKEEEDEPHLVGTRKDFFRTKASINKELNRARSPRPSGERKIPCKYSPLPSLGLAKDRSLVEGFEHSRAQQDAVWSLCTALNVPSKEQTASMSSCDPQIHLGANKPGRTLLAPLCDKKQHSHLQQNNQECLVLTPQVTPSKGKHSKKNKEDDQTVHFTPISRTSLSGKDENSSKVGENCHENLLKPKARFLSPARGSLEDEDDLNFPQNRRFSAPMSPRFMRRFNREKFYSSEKTEGSENDQHSEKETCPDRRSIFSPTSKDFDTIQDKKEDESIRKEFIKSNIKRGNRRSLDLSFNTNPMRLLSEIKVSLTGEPSSETTLSKSRIKPEKRKNSYGVSASSETVFKDFLPEVVSATSSSAVHSASRSRASTFTSLEAVVPLESKAFDSALLLDPGTRRLSHLSLSPRLSRKR